MEGAKFSRNFGPSACRSLRNDIWTITLLTKSVNKFCCFNYNQYTRICLPYVFPLSQASRKRWRRKSSMRRCLGEARQQRRRPQHGCPTDGGGTWCQAVPTLGCGHRDTARQVPDIGRATYQPVSSGVCRRRNCSPWRKLPSSRGSPRSLRMLKKSWLPTG
jgi:hypothetical protein